MDNTMMEALGEAPAMSVESLVTEKSIVMALREELPLMNTETATVKLVMQKLAIRFGMEFVDFKAKWRSRLRELLPDMIGLCQGGNVSGGGNDKADSDAEGDEEDEEIDLRPSRKRAPATKRNAVVDASDEEDEEGSDASEEEAKPEDNEDESEDDVVQAKKRRRTSDKSHTNTRKTKVPPAKKTKTTKEEDPVGLASLKELGRAAGVLNPQLYKVLKKADSTEEAEEILRDKLHDAGVTFQGSYPTSRDISAAKRKHDKDKELEGIDTSLIITGGRSRRGGGERISYREEFISGEEDSEDEDEKEDADEGDESDSSEASF
ncbi:hypothetical protein P3T76_000547 [Phytophthora citrophthora]|uniref:DEK C-terminal domain-containing protein n=1 Tax=Phytophthora citrophthora TaxID=4793 RepID=A0AAD9H0W4_9STRA|nr:hypothetical protein P3T76_000547 [Phytophthora citrophthora]